MPTARTTRSPGLTGRQSTVNCCSSRRNLSRFGAGIGSSARRYLTGKDAADLRSFTPTGAPMTSADWVDPLARSIALFIDGATDPDVSKDGAPMTDDDFLILVNAWWGRWPSKFLPMWRGSVGKLSAIVSIRVGQAMFQQSRSRAALGRCALFIRGQSGWLALPDLPSSQQCDHGHVPKPPAQSVCLGNWRGRRVARQVGPLCRFRPVVDRMPAAA